METRDKLMSLTQSNKIQQWLMDKSSNQDDVQLLQQQFSQQLDQKYNALLADEQAKLDQYVHEHIESQLKILIFRAYLKQSNAQFYLQNIRRCIQLTLNHLSHQL